MGENCVGATFRLPYEEFVLGKVLEIDPGERVEFEAAVPTAAPRLPYVWVLSESTAAVSVEEDCPIDSLAPVERCPPWTLYRVEWARPPEGIVRAIEEARGVVLSLTATLSAGWQFRVRFPDHGSLRAFTEHCTDHGIGAQLRDLSQGGAVSQGPGASGWAVLTGPQQEALSRALEIGYFDVPRRATLDELADDIGVSRQAASERVRRGLSTLLQELF